MSAGQKLSHLRLQAAPQRTELPGCYKSPPPPPKKKQSICESLCYSVALIREALFQSVAGSLSLALTLFAIRTLSDNEGSKPHSDRESPNTSGTEPRSAMASAVSNDGDSSPSERTPPRTLPSPPENPEPEERTRTTFNTESRGAVTREFPNDGGSRAGVLNVPAYAKNDLRAPENVHLLERSVMSPAESSSSRSSEVSIIIIIYLKYNTCEAKCFL